LRVAGVAVGGKEMARSPHFETGNHNKRSLTLALRKNKGEEVIYKLVKKSDVFLQNFGMCVAERTAVPYLELISPIIDNF